MKYFLKNKIVPLVSLLLLGACVQFKTASLYDGVEPALTPQKPDKIAAVVEPIIFEEDDTDVWGLEKNACQDNTLSKTVAYEGQKAIHLKWDRNAPECDWSGIGIGWDGYAGKDLSPLVNYAAIQFWVRSAKGKMFGLPIVLTLEDYSGGMGFAYTGNKYFERYSIDEEWQKVVVPLKAFDITKENLDLTNIKQLQLELQQSGEVYLDDIKLVFYEEPKQEPWLEEAKRPNPLALPKVLFDDHFINDNGWGMLKDQCREIELTKAEKSEGTTSIHVKWNDRGEDCRNIGLGVSWNQWFPVDISPIKSKAAIQFDLKNVGPSAAQLPIKVGFEDYERVTTLIDIQKDFTAGGQYGNQWNRILIPLSKLEGPANLTNVKQLIFQFEGQGEVYIDNIQLVD